MDTINLLDNFEYNKNWLDTHKSMEFSEQYTWDTWYKHVSKATHTENTHEKLHHTVMDQWAIEYWDDNNPKSHRIYKISEQQAMYWLKENYYHHWKHYWTNSDAEYWYTKLSEKLDIS